MLSHPCAVLDGCFPDDTVCIEAFPTVVLPAILGPLVVGKLGDRFGLVTASAVFCFHSFPS
jgi:hypothetical protein